MKVFIFTTSSLGENTLAKNASISIDVIEGKKLISKFFFDSTFGKNEDDSLGLFNEQGLKRFPNIEEFENRLNSIDFFVKNESIRTFPRYIRQIKNTNIFFYYRLPLDHSDDDIYIKFIKLLTEDILNIVGVNDQTIELHLILHQGDCCNNDIKGANRKISCDKGFGFKLKETIQKKNKELNELTIWTFSHNSDGIHQAIISNKSFFSKTNNQEDYLLEQLNNNCVTSSAYVENKLEIKEEPSENIDYFEIDLDKEGIESLINSRILIDRIAKWQLSGSSNTPNFKEEPRLIPFDKTNFEQSRPLLIVGKEKLSEYKSERRKNYLDSSIWCRYASNDEEKDTIKKYFKRNRELGLYSSSNAKESLEFWARMALESKLQDFGGHIENVVPFLFHSETEMKHKSQGAIEKIKQVSYTRDLKWRFLLIDDHAAFSLRGESCPIATKCEIICNTLKDFFEIDCNTNCQRNSFNTIETPKEPIGKIIFECAKNRSDAQSRIFEKRFDIILLDYLLGYIDENGNGIPTQKNKDNQIEYVDKSGNKYSETVEKPKTWKRDYSYLLLEEISNIKKDKKDIDKEKETENNIDSWQKSIGIYHHFWFYHISAFTNAIHQRILKQGMAYNTNYWYMSRGACPTTTPELFKYNLLSFMNRQIEVITGLSLNTTAQRKLKESNKENKRFITLLDLLTFIYKENESKEREFACVFFNALLNIRKNYDVLKYDSIYNKSIEKGSPLVRSLFTDIDYYDNAFWEHLMHLVYLTAYGTIRQWPEMWEEYIFIKSNLDKAEKTIAKENRVSTAIENYIIELKSSNS